MELFNLHLFDGESSGSEGMVAQSQTADSSMPTAEAQSSTEDRQKAYDDFKKANKDLFSADFQKQFDKRFKDHKQLEEKAKSQDEVITRLYDKYHVDSLEALNSAMDSDDSLFIDAADEAGMSIEQYKKFKALEKQNKELLEATKLRDSEEKARAQVQAWREEEKSVQGIYNSFNLDQELTNPLFSKMLQMGFSMKDAYQGTHFDELMQNAVGSTVAKVEKAVVDNVRAKGSRPIENGMASQGAFITKSNVNNLSSQELKEIAERVKRGERITF